MAENLKTAILITTLLLYDFSRDTPSLRTYIIYIRDITKYAYTVYIVR